MASPLDVRTLIAACATVYCGLGLAMFFVWRATPGTPGLGHFALAHALTVVGASLTAARGTVPEFLSAIVGNTMLVLAAASVLEGKRLFHGRAPLARASAVAVMLAGAALAWLLHVSPSERARVLVFTGTLGVLFGWAAFIDFRDGRRRDGGAAVLMAASLASLSGVLALRFTVALLGTRASDGLPAAVLLVASLGGVAGALGMVAAVNGRTLGALRLAEADLRDQKDLSQRLLAVARATSEGGTLPATLRRTLEVVNSLTQAAGSSLLMVGEEGSITGTVSARATAGVSIDPAGAERVMREGLAGWVARRRESALVEDTLTDSRWLHDRDSRPSVRSALSVPITRGADLLGVLTLVHGDPRHFSLEDLRLLESAAAQIALPVRNAQVSDSRLALAERQTLLLEVLASTARLLDPGETAQAAAEVISRRTRWSNVVIALPGEDGCLVLHGAPARSGSVVAQSTDGILGRALTTGRTQVVADVSVDPDYVAATPDTRSELAVPLRYRQRILGVLNLESDSGSAFGPEEVRLAESLSEMIALGIENARLYEAVAAQSARLNAVIRHSRDGLALLGSDAHILLLSEPLLRLLRMDSRPQEWQGRSLDELAGELARRAPQAAAALRTANQDSSEPTQPDEFALSGSVLEWESLPVPSQGRLLIVRDVTRERQIESMRRDLTHTLVHDLRSPLTGILGALTLMSAEFSPTDGQSRLIGVAETNVGRLLRLIDAILEVERLAQGGAPPARRRFSLPSMTRDVLRLASAHADSKGISLENGVPADLKDAWGDSELIGRVLENLVGNAIKFTPRGGSVRIDVMAERSGLRVTVTDDGPGVPAGLRPRLFERFAAGTQKERGSGLGLAFCRATIEAHDGRIWLEEAAGLGARFAFWLPDPSSAESVP